MASALSFSPRFSPSTNPPTPNSITAPKTLAFFPNKQIPRGSKSLSSQPSSRRPFGASLRVAAADPKTINGDKENHASAYEPDNKAEQKDLPSMKVLVQAYKKAIMDGDEKSVSELEAAINLIEKEKNNLSLQFGELAAEITSGKQQFLRLTADFENYRKRIEKDHQSLTSNVQGEVIESLLPLVDSFEKAKQYLQPETDKEKRIDTSYQGIYKQFVEIMRSLHVSVIGTVGKPFDPSIHEAISREESQNFKAGIVTEEVRRGFVLGDRLLRSATVKVSIGPGPGKVSSAGGESSEAAEAAATM